MLYPSIFGENLFDDFFRFPDFGRDVEKKLYGKHAAQVMKTDVHEHDDHYEIVIDLPGFKKENISVELKDGYLGISAHTQNETEEKDAEGAFVRKERFQGTCSRRFYVGEDIKNEDITASFENGVLSIKVPKKQEEPEPETGYSIAIN